MILIPFFIQVTLALLTIVGLALSKKTTLWAEVWKILGVSLLMTGLWLVGIWYWPSQYAYIILICVLILIALYRLRKPFISRGKIFSGFFYLPTLASTILGLLMVFSGVMGQLPPHGPFIELSPPLSKGENNCVLSGGNSLGVNFHYLVGPNGATNEEIHSIDFIKLNKGFRTNSSQLSKPQPSDNSDYIIFGSSIYAPCDGVVVGLETQKNDHAAGNKFRDRSGSNHVTLNCSGTMVLLAHMQRDSSKVDLGAEVKTGDLIGLVGNSGNTEEPHLHIHAYRLSIEKSLASPQVAIPVPMKFNDRYLSRRECL